MPALMNDHRRRPSPAERYVETGRGLTEQDVWWTDARGITRMIDNLTDDHRRFISRMLITQAASRYEARVAGRIEADFWSFSAWCDEHDQFPPDPDEELDPARIRDRIRNLTDTGAHLDWMRATPLFRRMIAGLTWTHPGVTGTDLDRAEPPAEAS